MITPFIAGVAGTGRTVGSRQVAIPHLNRMLGQYQLWHQQGEDERPEWILERLRRVWMLPGMHNAGGTFVDGYADAPNVTYEFDQLVIPDDIMSIKRELMRAARVLDGLYSGDSWARPLLAGFAMPTIDLAQFAFPTQPNLSAKSKGAFADTTLRDITNVHAKLGNKGMVVCLESPASLVGLHMAAANNMDVASVAAQYAEEFRLFAQQLPDVQLAIHLCRGDLNHKSWFGSIDSLEPLVILANAIAQAFAEANRQMPIMFLPTCAGDVLPSLDDKFFGPLGYLRKDIPVILANVHEMRSLEPDTPLDIAIGHNLLSTEMAVRALGWPGEGTQHLPHAVSFSCGARMSEEDWRFGIRVQRGMIEAAGLHGPVTPL